MFGYDVTRKLIIAVTAGAGEYNQDLSMEMNFTFLCDPGYCERITSIATNTTYNGTGWRKSRNIY